MSWFLGIINFGLYASDGMNELLDKLKKLDLEVQANELNYLYKQMLIWEQFKFILMLVSILFLFAANIEQIRKIVAFIITNIFQPILSFIKTKF